MVHTWAISVISQLSQYHQGNCFILALTLSSRLFKQLSITRSQQNPNTNLPPLQKLATKSWCLFFILPSSLSTWGLQSFLQEFLVRLISKKHSVIWINYQPSPPHCLLQFFKNNSSIFTWHALLKSHINWCTLFHIWLVRILFLHQ